jgi:hypothetical protein
MTISAYCAADGSPMTVPKCFSRHFGPGPRM